MDCGEHSVLRSETAFVCNKAYRGMERSEIRYASYAILRTVGLIGVAETGHVVDFAGARDASLRALLEMVRFAVDTRLSDRAFLAFPPRLRGKFRVQRHISARKKVPLRSDLPKPFPEKLQDHLGDQDVPHRLIAVTASCESFSHSYPGSELSQKR